MNEVLSHIKFIKMYLWEQSFTKRFEGNTYWVLNGISFIQFDSMYTYLCEHTEKERST